MRALLTCHGHTISAGFGGLAMPVQKVVKKKSPYSGICLRSAPNGADQIKILSWDGTGLCLYAKRLPDHALAWAMRFW
jgi:transposase